MKKILFLILLAGCSLRLAGQGIVVGRYQAGTEDEVRQQEPAQMPDVKKIRFALDVAYAYRTARAYDSSMDMLPWRSGISYGASLAGFWGYGFGIGGKFTGHSYSYDIEGISDRVNTVFVGPTFIYRLFNRKKTVAFIAECALGYMYYKETAGTMSIDGGSIGMIAEIGVDFRVARNTFIGLALKTFDGSVHIPLADARESLSSIGIGGGLRF